MAAGVSEKQAPGNPCCQLWRDRYSKLQEKRNALRHALKLFEQQLDKIQADNVNLKKACEEERERAEVEKEGRKKELAARLSLENETSTLKSEISVLQQKGGLQAQVRSEQVKLLQVHVSEGEKEINQLKELLEKEKIRADSEKKHAEAEKKRAAEAWKYVKAEKGKADEERRLANIEGNKAEEYRIQLEALSKEVDDARSKMVSLTLKMEEGDKKLEAEKRKVTKERKRADLEMDKAEEQRKQAEANRKQAEKEKCYAENLSRQLEETKQRVEEEKFTSHQLSQQLEEAKGRIDELQKQIYDLQSSRKMVQASSFFPEKYSNADSGKMKLLKKQLKFEKMQVKHAKQVAKLEKDRNVLLREELGRLKLDIVQFSHRLDLVDKCFSHKAEGIDTPGGKVMDESNMQVLKEKRYGVQPFPMSSQSKNGLLKPCCTTIAASGPFRQTLYVAPSHSLSGGNCSESISGIDSQDSKLESLLGGSSRKMSQTSAINSSSASFSDGLFMGSQERGAFSVTTSSKLMEESLNAQPTNLSISGEFNKMRCNTNLALVAEDSVRSPLKIAGIQSRNGSSKKRKRVLDAIESMELLHSDGKKLHLRMEEKLSDLHKMLRGQVDKSLEEANDIVPNPQETSYVKHEQRHKKRKTSHKETVGKQYLLSSNGEKGPEKLNGNINEDARVCRETSQPTTDLIGTAQPCAEGINDSVITDFETMETFEKLADRDFMKLLDLDNPVDEECYRAAMEMPLSPTLPEIKFHGTETFGMGQIEPLADNSLSGGLSNEKENILPPCSIDVIKVETNSNKLRNVSGDSHTSLLYENEGPLKNSCDLQGDNGNVSHGTKQAGKACDHQSKDFGVAGVILGPCTSRDEEAVPYESELGPAHNNILKMFVVLYDFKDNSSFSRLFCATKNCMGRCSFTETEWTLQKILLALKTEENLFSKEKVCVFFSLFLNFSRAALGKIRNFVSRDSTTCLDSFARHVSAVMLDAEARSVLDTLCSDGLFSLIENFLVDGRVLKCVDKSSETSGEHNSKNNVLPDGVNIIFSVEAASVNQLVAGSFLLASLSAATDHSGFIAEASYRVLRVHRCEPSLVLLILHIFAYLGGEKLFTLMKENLTMTVVKSIVTFLETESFQAAVTSCLPSANNIQTEFHPCAECPFAKDAVSIDIALSLLLEKLQSVQSGTLNLVSPKDQAEESCRELYHVLDRKDGDSCLFKNYEMPAFQSESVVCMTLCHVTDVLSLVELLACNMRWDWTCTTIIPELLRMLESPMQESLTAAIFILLGQLGRLGVNACGYEDKEVESLRSKLSACLWRDASNRVGLPVQIAIVTALLGLLSLDFDQVFQMNTKCPATANQSSPAYHIRKWFSSLSKENQALSLRLLQ